MLHSRDIDLMKSDMTRYQAADALGLILYGRKGSRFHEFRVAFLQGIEDHETSRWVEPRGLGPIAVGYRLAAVWSERR